MKIYLLPLLLLMAFNCLGQNIITGRIINKTDKKPVVGAVVFLNNSVIENATNNDGVFTLTNVPRGEYQLMVNIIGYEAARVPVSINGNTTLTDIAITPKNEVLQDVNIKAKAVLSSCYPAFEAAFFGRTLFARQCKILNPYAVQFFDINPQGGFSARSDKFIEIENDALGYKIKFMLNFFNIDAKTTRTYFSGQSYFEKMKGTPSQEAEWRKNRLECYQGSVMQLLRSIIADSIKENGYVIKRAHRENNTYFNPNGLETDPYDIDNSVDFFGESDNIRYHDKLLANIEKSKDILLKTNNEGIFAMAGLIDSTKNNSLYVEHSGNTMPGPDGKTIHVRWMWNSTVSFITFTKPYVIFDHNGKILNPRSVSFSGFFTEQTRIATQLPFDYKPGE